MNCLFKRITAFILAFIMAFFSIQYVYASGGSTDQKSAESSGVISDEEWTKIQDEYSENDPNDTWDHETWDYEHKELAWAAFGATEWTSSSFPSLNFSSYGVGSYETKHLDDAAKQEITEAVTNYKFATGMYTLKTTKDDGTTGIDNSAYVTLVLACMDVLAARGTSEDLYAVGSYILHYGKDKVSSMYLSDNESCHSNVALLILRRIVSAERYYNLSHKEKVSIYSKDDHGLYFVIQSVVYNTLYAMHKDEGEDDYCDEYSEEDADEYFDYKERGDLGYKKWNSFAKDVLDGYSCGAIEGTYIMDAFGGRVDEGGNLPDASGGDGGGSGNMVTMDLGKIKLKLNEAYNVCTSPLTKRMGVKMFNGHKETYYSETVLHGGGLDIPGRHVADDGTIRDGDGYICVAAATSYLAKGSTLLTSLGPAKVYDCGCAHGTIDIYVNSDYFK